MVAKKICVLIFLFALLWCTPANGQSKQISIAAASDLKFALDSIIAMFNGGDVVVTYGSSGKLFEQIQHGAPFDIFFSADISYPQELYEKGLTTAPPINYGEGRLVMWTANSKSGMEELSSLTNSSVKKISIANPRHAPYGKRAVEALETLNLYDKVKAKLILGANISQAAQYVYSGAADAGIIALSLALSPTMKDKGRYVLIPESTHAPLQQAFVVIKQKDKGDTADFVNFIQSEKAKEILAYFGFRPGTPIHR